MIDVMIDGQKNLSRIKVQKVMEGMRAVLYIGWPGKVAPEEVIFPQRPKGHEDYQWPKGHRGMNHVALQRKAVPQAAGTASTVALRQA